MEEFKAYSPHQLRATGFNTKDYAPNQKTGLFTGRLEMKVWGRNANLISFYTLSDGRKISCNTWQNKEYLGIDQLPFGTEVTLKFIRNSKGHITLAEVCTYVRPAGSKCFRDLR